MWNDDETQFEAMVWHMNELGVEQPELDEDTQVAADILRGLTWQDAEPLGRRLGNVRGMIAYLQSRPMPESRALARQELQMLESLRAVEAVGQELVNREAGDFAAELAFATDRCRFEELLFAASEEFFELVEWLDEPFPMRARAGSKGGAR
ncbi:MAG TPA: hypothetical protein VMB50_03545 [Myxococcales bacterium]|nr:hypothetical protein [Myxococcales bacterium]